MQFSKIFLGCTLSLICTSYAAEVDIRPGITSAIVSQKIDSERFTQNHADSITINPSVVATLQSRTFTGSWSALHTHIETNRTGERTNQNYTDFDYQATYTPIENILSIGFNGSLRNRNQQASDLIVNDPFLGSQALRKVRNNGVSANLTMQNNPWLESNVSVNASEIDSESTTNNAGSLSNQNYSVNTEFTHGNKIKRVGWFVSTNFTKTDSARRNDLLTRNANATFNIGLISELSLSFTGSHEANQITNQLRILRTLGIDSLGAGLTWGRSANRFVRVTYNRTSEEDEDGENFVGVDLNWAFSRRTSIEANYGRRFFGDSGSFSLNHNTKSIRTRLQYEESVTSFARLVGTDVQTSVFVCPDGNSTLSNCFQPASLDYSLNPGEVFAQFRETTPEISEDPILRKSLNGSIGYDWRRIKSSIQVSHTETEFLNQDRQQTRTNYGFQLSYQLGQKSNLTSRVDYANTQEDGLDNDIETLITSTTFERTLGQNLSASFEFRFLDRKGNDPARDIVDRRITASLIYRWD